MVPMEVRQIKHPQRLPIHATITVAQFLALFTISYVAKILFFICFEVYQPSLPTNISYADFLKSVPQIFLLFLFFLTLCLLTVIAARPKFTNIINCISFPHTSNSLIFCLALVALSVFIFNNAEILELKLSNVYSLLIRSNIIKKDDYLSGWIGISSAINQFCIYFFYLSCCIAIRQKSFLHFLP